MSWEPSPSMETHGSYGFGFFPQFSVGLVWPGTLSSCLRTGLGAGLRFLGTREGWREPPWHPPEQGAVEPQQQGLPSAHLPPPGRGSRGPPGAVAQAQGVFLSESFCRLLGRGNAECRAP